MKTALTLMILAQSYNAYACPQYLRGFGNWFHFHRQDKLAVSVSDCLERPPSELNFADVKRRLAKLGKAGKPANFIANAVQGERRLGYGFYATVWDLPELPGYALRGDHIEIRRGDGKEYWFKLTRVADYAPNHNFGQAVAKVGPYEIVKKPAGRPITYEALSYKYEFESDDETKEQKTRAEYLQVQRQIAAMDLEAYTQLAKDLSFLRTVRKGCDASPRHILVDPVHQRFHLVEIGKSQDIPPVSVELLMRFLSDADKWKTANWPEIIGLSSQIIEKVLTVAKSEGLPANERDPDYRYARLVAGMPDTHDFRTPTDRETASVAFESLLEQKLSELPLKRKVALLASLCLVRFRSLKALPDRDLMSFIRENPEMEYQISFQALDRLAKTHSLLVPIRILQISQLAMKAQDVIFGNEALAHFQEFQGKFTNTSLNYFKNHPQDVPL